MPRKAKPPRLHLRPARADRGATWVILDRGREISTGCGEGDNEGAERALARHLADKYERPALGSRLDQIPVAAVIEIYLKEHGPKVKRLSNITQSTDPLLDWWGAKDCTLADVRSATCDQYVTWRTSQPRKHRRTGLISKTTARHDLSILNAAIKHYHENYGPLPALPSVARPAPRPPREDYWLTRKQVAERIRAARRLPQCGHIIRVLLIGVYSGTRPGATRALHWIPSTIGGWFDLHTEILHRRPRGEVENNKRKPKARIHRKLLYWLRAWRKADMTDGVVRRERVGGRRIRVRVACPHVIHYAGKPVSHVYKAWARVAIEAGHGVWNAERKQWECQDGPHICRHTAATWLMQAGVDKAEIAGYLGMSEKVLDEVYGHHHPDFQNNAANASGRRTPMKRPGIR
jgi:integrase